MLTAEWNGMTLVRNGKNILSIEIYSEKTYNSAEKNENTPTLKILLRTMIKRS